MSITLPRSLKRAYAQVLRKLMSCRVPFVVGGDWAVEHFVQLGRPICDLDLMLEPTSVDQARAALLGIGACELGRDAQQVRFGFASGEIALVHHFAQGTCAVDEAWYRRGIPGKVFGVATLIASPSNLIWAKAFVAARHRFDGADIVHLIRATYASLDWGHLHSVLAPDPQLLFAYLTLFDFCYPDSRHAVPSWLWDELQANFQQPIEPTLPWVCRGPLLDHVSFDFDLIAKGFLDSRLVFPEA